VLSRYVATLVSPVTPLDPVTFVAVPVVLVVTAAIAVAAPPGAPRVSIPSSRFESNSQPELWSLGARTRKGLCVGVSAPPRFVITGIG
jgi:hypothetical protein